MEPGSLSNFVFVYFEAIFCGVLFLLWGVLLLSLLRISVKKRKMESAQFCRQAGWCWLGTLFVLLFIILAPKRVKAVVLETLPGFIEGAMAALPICFALIFTIIGIVALFDEEKEV